MIHMSVNKYKCIVDWISKYPNSSSWVYFNASEMEDGNTSVNSVGGDSKLREYIDGSYDAALTFEMSIVKLYDSEQSDINTDALAEIDDLVEWIENTDEELSFGNNHRITDIEVLSLTPNIAVNEAENLARYTFYGKVYYTFNND